MQHIDHLNGAAPRDDDDLAQIVDDLVCTLILRSADTPDELERVIVDTMAGVIQGATEMTCDVCEAARGAVRGVARSAARLGLPADPLIALATESLFRNALPCGVDGDELIAAMRDGATATGAGASSAAMPTHFNWREPTTSM